MKKFILFLWILTLLGLFIGLGLQGNKFVKERAGILCFSCVGLEK